MAQQILTDPNFTQWTSEAIKRGCQSWIAVPLKANNGKVIGSMNIYAADPDAFNDQEKKPLCDFTDILSYGIMDLSGRYSGLM